MGVLVSFVSALEFGVYPPILTFEGKVGEEQCANLTLFSSEIVRVKVSDRWKNATGKAYEIGSYTRDATATNIQMNYENEVSVKRKKLYGVCATLLRSGKHEGVLIFAPEHSNLEMGVWISMTAEGDSGEKEEGQRVQEGRQLITGAVAGIGDRKNGIAPLLALTTLLLLVFLVFLVKARR